LAWPHALATHGRPARPMLIPIATVRLPRRRAQRHHRESARSGRIRVAGHASAPIPTRGDRALIESESEHDMAAAAAKRPEAEGRLRTRHHQPKHAEKLIAVRNGGPPLWWGGRRTDRSWPPTSRRSWSTTREVVILDNGEMAVLSRQGARFVGMDGREVRRARAGSWDSAAGEKAATPLHAEGDLRAATAIETRTASGSTSMPARSCCRDRPLWRELAKVRRSHPGVRHIVPRRRSRGGT
jgi:hypothetical protein